MKPKLNTSSSLQRGSKAVMSAASRIRSTFTLSHSTSLVSAASLQSMFNSNKQSSTINSQQQLDSQSISLYDTNTAGNITNQSTNNTINNASKQKNANKLDRQNKSLINQTQPINEQQEDEANGLLGNQTVNGTSAANDDGVCKDNAIVAFGVIRGIAIGPDDELIIADESRVRVLQPGDEYFFKRELFVQQQSRSESHQYNHHSGHPALTNKGRLCAMTYDAQSRQLLTLHTSLSNGTPYIQVIDYQTGKTKFIIDSNDSKLIRPSSLATYGQHVIVTDLGNDCIKKYRFY